MAFGTITNGTALVVGASQGIGLGFVQHLLQDGRFQRVYGTYRNPDTAAALVALARHHPQLVALPADVTQEATLAQLAADIQAQTPHLHLALYCVGVLHDGAMQPEKSVRQLQADPLIRYFQVNAIGAALLTRYLLPLLKHDQPSVFAAVSAKIGSIGDNRAGGWYGYRASKAALNMFIKTAAIEYSRKSPHTTLALLHPGTTNTRLSEPFQRGVPPEKLFPVARTVAQLMAIIDGLEPAHSGDFFNWDGNLLPW